MRKKNAVFALTVKSIMAFEKHFKPFIGRFLMHIKICAVKL